MPLNKKSCPSLFIICTSIFFTLFISGMEKPSHKEALEEKQAAAREKKIHLEAIKIKRALKKDYILQAAEKELKICSGKRLLCHCAMVIIQNNCASAVSVGEDFKTITPNTQKTIIIEFKKISKRLGYFELPIYDSENSLIAQLEGFRSRLINEIKSHSFGTQFSTFYNDGSEPIMSAMIDAEKDYLVHLELNGTTRVIGEMKLDVAQKNSPREEKNKQPLTRKLSVSSSCTSLNTKGGQAQIKYDTELGYIAPKPKGAIVVLQSARLEEKKPAFPPAKRISAKVEDVQSPQEDISGTLIDFKNATMRALKKTGSLIKLNGDQNTDLNKNECQNKKE